MLKYLKIKIIPKNSIEIKESGMYRYATNAGIVNVVTKMIRLNAATNVNATVIGTLASMMARSGRPS